MYRMFCTLTSAVGWKEGAKICWNDVFREKHLVLTLKHTSNPYNICQYGCYSKVSADVKADVADVKSDVLNRMLNRMLHSRRHKGRPGAFKRARPAVLCMLIADI